MDLSSLLFSIIISAVIFQIILFSIRVWQFRKIINKIPGPKSPPFLGITLEVAKKPVEDRLDYLKNLTYKFKDGIVRVWVGPNPTVFIRKPRQMEIILPNTVQITKSLVYNYIKIWLGEGLVTSSGSKWFHDRKMITPSFHFGVLEQFSEVMFEKTQVLNEIIAELVAKNPKKPIDIFDYSVRCTLDVICETAMGLTLDCQRDKNSAYGQAVHTFSVLTIKRIVRPWLKSDFIYYMTKDGKEYMKAVETMHEFSTKVIKIKQEERKTNKMLQSTDYNDETGTKKRKAFLDLLLDTVESENKSMSNEELREHVDTFMFAGHDTTATAISWAIFLLGHHPEIQEKVHKELDEVLGHSSEHPSQKDLANLKYLELVMKETLRLYPSAPQVSRHITEDIEIDGYKIPKGTTLVIGIFLLHRDPEVWPNPDKFDPDRFLPENTKGRHPYAYIPFSAGPRNCIGQKFAMMEFKIILASILRKWRIKSARSIQDTKMVSAFILRPHEGIPVYFTPK